MAQTFTLSSPAFEQHKAIPLKYTCDGQNISPELTWDNQPAGTLSFALIVDDPDAPAKTFTHWLVYAIPATMTRLPENIGSQKIIFGINDTNKMGWTGPCPPSGTHHYFFTLYALDTVINLTAGASKETLLQTMQGHILGKAELIGLYSKK